MLTPEVLRAELEKRLPAFADDYGEDVFDPWTLFPAIYGGYNSEMGEVAIGVLRMTVTRDWSVSDKIGLAGEIMQEMLCVSDVCNYGTSPRVCFPNNEEFRSILTEWIPAFEAHEKMRWEDADA